MIMIYDLSDKSVLHFSREKKMLITTFFSSLNIIKLKRRTNFFKFLPITETACPIKLYIQQDVIAWIITSRVTCDPTEKKETNHYYHFKEFINIVP